MAHRQRQVLLPGTGAEERTELTTALTPSERCELERYEDIIEKGLATFVDVACALFTIRERRLYRATHPYLSKGYCREHLDIGRSYASRLLGAGERLKLLPKDSSLPKPLNENQIRPFLRLPAAEFPKAWKRAVKMANEGRADSARSQGSRPRDGAKRSRASQKQHQTEYFQSEAAVRPDPGFASRNQTESGERPDR